MRVSHLLSITAALTLAACGGSNAFAPGTTPSVGDAQSVRTGVLALNGKTYYLGLTQSAAGHLESLVSFHAAPYTPAASAFDLNLSRISATAKPSTNAVVHQQTLVAATTAGKSAIHANVVSPDDVVIMHRPDPAGGTDVFVFNVGPDGNATLIEWWYEPAQA